MDFDSLASCLPSLESGIRASYRVERRRANPAFWPYVDALNAFTLRGGKRLRALLVLAGFHLATGRAPRPALPAAVALEHFQSWMLIHDDIIDHAVQRRGGPTVHRALRDLFRTRQGIGDAEAFGVGMGITLGDLQEPFTIAALLASKVPAPARLSALAEYVRMTRATAYGQILDIENGSRPVGEVSEEMVLLVHRLKSAIYTVASPLRIGASLGGARKALLEDLDAVGVDLGVAFQLRDDILGTGFDAGAAGKSANDLVEGKRTLLVVKAWEQSTPEGRAKIATVLGNAAATPDAVETVRQVIRSTGSLAYSEQRIRDLHLRANRRIRRSRSIRSAGKPLLEQIGEKLVHRKI